MVNEQNAESGHVHGWSAVFVIDGKQYQHCVNNCPEAAVRPAPIDGSVES